MSETGAGCPVSMAGIYAWCWLLGPWAGGRGGLAAESAKKAVNVKAVSGSLGKEKLLKFLVEAMTLKTK